MMFWWDFRYIARYTPELGAGVCSEACVEMAGFVCSSHWVLQSRLWALASEWGTEGIVMAAVWSSERLFPVNTDRKRKQFNSWLPHTSVPPPFPNTHLLFCRHPYLFWQVYSRMWGRKCIPIQMTKPIWGASTAASATLFWISTFFPGQLYIAVYWRSYQLSG